MNSFPLIVIYYLSVFFECKKLTTEENEKRLEVCGLALKPKVFNGREVKKNEAPWTVMVHTVAGGNTHGHCTGTVLSPRHVLTATHCSATGDLVQWIQNDVRYQFDKKDCEWDKTLIIPEVSASKVTILTRNGTTIGRAKFLYMFKYCRKIKDKETYDYQFPDDFMIVEVAEDLEYSSEVQPACFARDIEDNPLGTVLDFFGYGDNPPVHLAKSTSSKNRLLYQKINIIEDSSNGYVFRTDPRIFIARSVSEQTIACPGDSGGGAISKIDGRNTVVGVAMRGSCEKMNRGKDAIEIYAAAGYYSEDVCELTGICNPPKASERRTIIMTLFISTFIAFLVN